AGATNAYPGPRLGFRPWRLLTAVMLGAGFAVKWDGLYILPAFALLAFVWDVGARRAAGVPAPVRAAIRRDWLGWVPSFALLPVATYTLTWAGWFLGSDSLAYDRNSVNNVHRSGIIGSLQNWIAYQCQAYDFHKNLTDTDHYGGGTLIPFTNFCVDPHTFHAAGKLHPYLSKPFGWFFISRPVAFYYEAPPTGTDGCHAKSCSAEILDIGTPMIWWVGIPVLVLLLGLWAAWRDWRAAMILVVFAATFFPWALFESRQMFEFYALTTLPLVVLAITMIAGWILGPPGAGDNRRLWGGLGVGGYLLLAGANFFWLYPILTGQTLSYANWHARMWFPGWI
ncbi:MAG TPA: hypothetical protein VMU90_09095, partial [Solirubrobacteraceae bacterium]|nr:hypothetical protein [Solirubrobacteraceae bacterium]